MSHDDPFTIDLFGNTALSSGLGLGVTAFGSSFEVDVDDDPDPSSPTPAMPGSAVMRPQSTSTRVRGSNFHLAGMRSLAKSWKQRAQDNLAAIRLASEIESNGRPATEQEQAQLIKFTGFGASDLANGVFRRPGEQKFRKGWEDIGAGLEDAVGEIDYASLARCTQYAHFTPEFIVRAIWTGLQRLGWHGGRVLEPGIGTGLFAALMPEPLRNQSHVTGVELDPVTARIARLLQPRARIVTGDFVRTELPAHFDLVIGNPPFSDRTVRSDPKYRSVGLRLLPDQVDTFLAKWKTELTLSGAPGLIGEYLSKVEDSSFHEGVTWEFEADERDDTAQWRSSTYVSFVNVGIWESADDFMAAVGKYMGKGRTLKEIFEAAPRRRAILTPQHWRIGLSPMPFSTSPEVVA